jgi:hypothetical protein
MGTEADPNFTVAAGPAFPPLRERVLEFRLPFVTILSPTPFMTLGMVFNLNQPGFHNPLWVRALMVGTPAWIRTKDQLIKSQLLYQLSYRGLGYLPLWESIPCAGKRWGWFNGTLTTGQGQI